VAYPEHAAVTFIEAGVVFDVFALRVLVEFGERHSPLTARLTRNARD
jgi:hypothetical protein